MWNLFKEVWRSLFKNKATVAGLTILVFLTAGIFTVMHDTAKAMKNQYKRYKDSSVAHDLTVDLNLPISGSVYNNGFFINGLSKKDGSIDYNKPIKYYPSNNKKVTSIIDFETIKDRYFSLSNFINDNSYINKYISRSDFLSLYNTYIPETPESGILKLNFDNDEKFFTLKQKRTLPVFVKNGQEYTEDKSETQLDKSGRFRFDKQYTLNEISYITSTNEENINLSQLATLFINSKTKEMTFDSIKGNEWSETVSVIKITNLELAKLLGFKSLENNEFVYEVDKSITPRMIEIAQDDKVSNFVNKELKSDYSYADFFDSKTIKLKITNKFTFEADTNYKIPLNWAFKKTQTTSFERKRYTTTYIDGYKDKWSGSYKTFMENMISDHGAIPKDFADISFWEKNVSTEIARYVNKNNKVTLSDVIKTTNDKNIVTLDEINTILLTFAPQSDQPSGIKYSDFDFNSSKTIAQIEGHNKVDSETYLNLSNKSIANDLLIKIRNGALNITKQEIYKFAYERVSKENIGIRQTITIDSFDEKDGGKKVYHFVNTGDEKQMISGIQNNINKLINSDKFESLNKSSQNIAEYFKTKEIDPYISSVILKQTFENILPYETYIQPDFDYEQIVFTNEENSDVTVQNRAKVYKLAHFLNDPNRNADEYNKFANIGIARFSNGNYVILLPEYSNGKITLWRNAKIKDLPNGIISNEILHKWLVSNQLTLKVNLPSESFVEKSPDFANSVFLPFGFRGPDVEVVNQALNENTLRLAIERLQKNILNTSFYREGFIKEDTIFVFVKALNETFEKNEFAKIFSSGEINFNVLPKIILDGIYEITHDLSGDYLRKFLIDFINKLIELVNTKSSEEEKKEYIAQNIDNLFSFIQILSGNKIINFSAISQILKVSKDANTFLEIVKELFNSINFRKITDYTDNFFKEHHNKTTTINNIDYIRKLSVFDIMLAVLEGIDQVPLKSTLIKLVDNLEVKFLTDFNNKNNPIFLLLGFLPDSVKSILSSLNSYKEDDANAFRNVIDGIKFFINNFDFNVLRHTLHEKVKEETYTTNAIEFNKIVGANVSVRRDFLLTTISIDDIIYATLKSIFNTPGSNKRVKEELIKMLNISSKGTNIEISDNKFLTIPAADSEKVGFFEILGLLNSNNTNNATSASSSSDSKPQPAWSIPEGTLGRIEHFINILKNQKEDISVSKLSNNDKQIALAYFEWDVNNEKTISLDTIKNTINSWQPLLNSLKYNKDKFNYNDIKDSFANLFHTLHNFKNTSNSSVFNILSSKLLSQLINIEYTDYTYLKDLFPILKLWFKVFEENVSYEKATQFANALLDLANKARIIESFNSFDLFKPSAQNIAGFEETDFGISRSLANPREMRNLFFKKENDTYLDKDLNVLLNKYPEFKTFLNKNEFLITQTFSYIAASAKYASIDENQKTYKDTHLKYRNIYSFFIDQTINNFLQKSYVKNKFQIIKKLFYNEYNNDSFEAIGISDVLINNILRKMYPQVVIWTLADTNNVGGELKNNANLAYFIQNKLINFENLLVDEKTVTEFLKSLTKEVYFFPSVENDVTFQIAIDNDMFVKLKSEVQKNPSKYHFFGIDINEFFFSILDSITGLTKLNNILSFNQPASYIAKVNYAFLRQNHKEIYTGELPSNPIQMKELINIIPDKYTISINGSKYIIIGEDMTFDYFYPILDENNLQVNTKDQAIVYVNNNGFDRIRQAYRGTAVKEYMTIKYDNKAEGSVANFKDKLEQFVQARIDDVAKLKRTFMYNELDPINPERSLRVKTTEQIIKSVTYTSNILLAILITLVTISIIFIIKRYIANKNTVIGILIAQGYTPLQIASSLSVFAIFTLLIGDLLGYIVGFMLQSTGIRILENYWTVPVETLYFEPLSLILNIVIPLIAMTLLIIFIALRSLRYKSIDLMSGIVEVKINELHNKYQKLFKNRSIKTKFGTSLIFNSFWKLTSFAISVILASITTIVGFATFGVFEKSINETYINRKYNYKFDLVTPTKEGGLYNPFFVEDLDRVLYVPVGDIRELNQYQSDYFGAGKSKSINLTDEKGNVKNGNPTPFDGHVITQFSVNIKINSSVSVDPFEVVYNSLPDTQKSRILQLRDKVGFALMKSQEGVQFQDNGKSNIIDLDKTLANNVTEFFQYIPNPENIINGKFFFVQWDKDQKVFNHKIISTDEYRDEYRNFLVKGYQYIEKHTNVKDYFVSFNGLIFNNDTNETYTYLESTYKKEDIKLYGYNHNSKQIKVVGKEEQNLLYEIEDLFRKAGSDVTKPIPLIVNNVSRKKFNLNRGDLIKLKINNKVDRYSLLFDKKLNNGSYENKLEELEKEYTFYVHEYNPTFINNEFIIPKSAADEIIGFNKVFEDKLNSLQDKPTNIDSNKYKFNGIFSRDALPIQLILSTALYTPSGYSGSLDSFNIENTSLKDKRDFFDGIFGTRETSVNIITEGIMPRLGFDNYQIAKFLNENFNKETDNYLAVYKEARENPDIYIKEFASIFDNQLFIPSAYTLESKDIEVGFTLSIAKTVQIIVTIVTALSFIISIIILIIISTILINENERNIAIWSILGYSSKEKIKMFFGIYIPFIIVSLAFAFPLAYGFMSVFSGFLTTSASISIPLTISVFNVLFTTLIVFGVFLVTSLLSWFNINKIKAIDLLKGK
ncbi:FtsX-like permease family protein [Mycoplasmopsis edwardii]|nr:FtsX-like permease family protein [Mycoplasmopsis edwardii]